ncbi:MAG: LysR substrate-binding domain-containing protein [Paracoccaceae bacterium]|nr:LysR substrate-binding domain-containing protein [Paracoccaceae bacterium]
MIKRTAPLNALRAFEAAARTGSFANAAREFGVSPAAISQQVRLLEEFWGTTLFVRQGNRIALTDAGLTAYPSLGDAMVTIEELSSQMLRTPHRNRLVLSAPQSVAETWLASRLSVLDLSDLGLPLDIRIDDDPIDFVQDSIDIRIFYGHDLYGDYQVDALFSDTLVAVASPEFVALHGRVPGNVDDHRLIHTDWGQAYSTSPNWNRFLAGNRIVNQNSGLRVQSSSTALNFARNGCGVALIPQTIAECDLSSGRVIQLDEPPIPMTHGYRVAYPKRLARSPVVRSVIRALGA